MAQRKPTRRIPRIAVVVVPLMALGVILALLSLAWRSNKEVRRTPGEGATEATPVDATASSFLGCTDCHGDLDKKLSKGLVPNLKYTHERHFATGVSDCAVCHPTPAHEADQINKPTMARCFLCHGVTKKAIAPGACSTCHPPGMPSKPESHLVSDWVTAKHAKMANDDRFQCLTCHQESFCSSCHGLQIPHPEGWAQEAHTVAFFDDPNVCQRCHERAPDQPDFCDTCHHVQGPEGEPWRQVHPSIVRSRGAFDCFQCHNPATCATCHIEGRETFAADKGYEPEGQTPSDYPTSLTPSPSG